MTKGKTFVVDIDDTLLKSADDKCIECGHKKYKNPIKVKREVNRLNKLYKYNIIILYTGRSWEYYDLTVKQLNKVGIKYHQLLMGKPLGIYIDYDAKTTLKGFV